MLLGFLGQLESVCNKPKGRTRFKSLYFVGYNVFDKVKSDCFSNPSLMLLNEGGIIKQVRLGFIQDNALFGF